MEKVTEQEVRVSTGHQAARNRDPESSSLLGVWVCAQSLQSCPTFCDPMDCRPPGFTVYGILQARILKWVAISSCRGSSWPRDWTHIELTSSALASRFFTTESSGNPSYKILNLDNWGSRYVCIVVIGILELIEIPSNIFCSYLINAVLM